MTTTTKRRQKRREQLGLARTYAAGRTTGEADGYRRGYAEGQRAERQLHEATYAVGSPGYGLHGDPIQLNQEPEHTLVRLLFDRALAVVDPLDPRIYSRAADGRHVATFRARKKAWRDGITGHTVVWYDWDFDGVHSG